MKNNHKVLLTYLTSAAGPAILLLLLTASLHIYPFGDKMFLWIDADQNLGYYSYLQSLSDKNTILYSWSNVLGGNALPSLAFFAFSPFNLFLVLFPGHLVLLTHVIAYSKIIISALTFCFFLNQIAPEKHGVAKIVCSISYAFMGYTIFFGWHSAWLDAVVILPLIISGIFRLYRMNKPYLYIFSLTYGIIAQYYLGYMLGLASILFFIFFLVSSKENQQITLLQHIRKSKSLILRYIISTCISVGMSCIVLIPAYLGIPKFRKTSPLQYFKDMHYNTSSFEVISGLFSGRVDIFDNAAPIIYVGILPIFFIFAFFLNKQVSKTQKYSFAGLLIVFFISVINSFINIFWHGLSVNAWFNFRYSFIISFLLLYIAFEGMAALRYDEKYTQILLRSVLITAGLFLVVITFVPGKNNGLLITWDIISIIFVAWILALSIRKNRGRTIAASVVIIQVLLSLFLNSFLIVSKQNLYTVSAYNKGEELVTAAKDIINDDSFYRMESSYQFGRGNASLYNYYGVTNYSSAENKAVIDFTKNFGINSNWMASKYNSNIPYSAESLIGIKYIISDEIHDKPYRKIGKLNGDYTLYNNPSALPLVFVQENINEHISTDDTYSTLNSMYQSLNKSTEPIFTPNIVTRAEHVPELQHANDKTITLDINIQKSGAVYLSVPKYMQSITITTPHHASHNIKVSGDEQNYYLGQFSKDDEISLEITPNNSKLTDDDIISYTENTPLVAKVLSKVISSEQISISEQSSSHLDIVYSGNSQYLSTTIPYDDSWTVIDNGKVVQPVKNWDVFMSIPLDQTANTHHITMKYVPRGLKIGSIICLASIAGLVGMAVQTKRSKAHNSAIK